MLEEKKRKEIMRGEGKREREEGTYVDVLQELKNFLSFFCCFSLCLGVYFFAFHLISLS